MEWIDWYAAIRCTAVAALPIRSFDNVAKKYTYTSYIYTQQYNSIEQKINENETKKLYAYSSFCELSFSRMPLLESKTWPQSFGRLVDPNFRFNPWYLLLYLVNLLICHDLLMCVLFLIPVKLIVDLWKHRWNQI